MSDSRNWFVGFHFQDKMTPLIVATQHRFPRIVEILLRNGADPNVQEGGIWVCFGLFFAFFGYVTALFRERSDDQR